MNSYYMSLLLPNQSGPDDVIHILVCVLRRHKPGMGGCLYLTLIDGAYVPKQPLDRVWSVSARVLRRDNLLEHMGGLVREGDRER